MILLSLLLAGDFQCDGKTASDLNLEVVEEKCLYSYLVGYMGYGAGNAQK